MCTNVQQDKHRIYALNKHLRAAHTHTTTLESRPSTISENHIHGTQHNSEISTI